MDTDDCGTEYMTCKSNSVLGKTVKVKSKKAFQVNNMLFGVKNNTVLF